MYKPGLTEGKAGRGPGPGVSPGVGERAMQRGYRVGKSRERSTDRPRAPFGGTGASHTVRRDTTARDKDARKENTTPREGKGEEH